MGRRYRAPVSLRRPPHQLRATVLGAGTMGAQIAAHLANAGLRVTLLDVVPSNVPKGSPPKLRNAIATSAIGNMRKQKPAPYMEPAVATRIRPGNLEDDLETAVAQSDLVVEAVIERLDIKRPLFDRIGKAAPAHAILATNTSGLPIREIVAELPPPVRTRVVGMHFFNPPRYMHLLEVVPSGETDPAVVAELSDFSDRVLGKGVVVCRDTPNFIGNRIGIAEMVLTNAAAFGGGYTVEEVDFLNGPLMGRPRTGSFRLGDLVGIDVVALVITNLRRAVDDELRDLLVVEPTIAKMIDKGMLGDKTGHGFYKKSRDEKGRRKILSLDLKTLEYRDRIEPDFPELAKVANIPDLTERVAAAIRTEGRGGDLLRQVYLPLLNYAAHRLGTICDTPRQIDDAMAWGYGWSLGPFALWDAIGVKWGTEQLRARGIDPAPAVVSLLASPDNATWYGTDPGHPTVYVAEADRHQPIETPPGMLFLPSLKAGGAEIHTTDAASLVDLGDGVACVEFRSKMNTLGPGVLPMLEQVFEVLEARGGFRAIVVGNQGPHFSAGADAREILAMAESGDWSGIDAMVARFQDTLMELRHGPIPVVAAPHGMTLGGGCECSMQTAGITAHAELYMGLVEAGIGLVPAGGGLKEIARRASDWAAQVPDADPYLFLRRGFEAASTATVSTSAHHAKNLGFLRPTDRIRFHKSRVIADAKRMAIGLAEAGWTPPDRDAPITVVGAPHGASFFMGAWLFQQGGYASDHDKLVGEKVAHVLSGGMVPARARLTADRLLELEREAFVSLCGEEKTRARVAHTLKTGKPLRN